MNQINNEKKRGTFRIKPAEKYKTIFDEQSWERKNERISKISEKDWNITYVRPLDSYVELNVPQAQTL